MVVEDWTSLTWIVRALAVVYFVTFPVLTEEWYGTILSCLQTPCDRSNWAQASIWYRQLFSVTWSCQQRIGSYLCIPLDAGHMSVAPCLVFWRSFCATLQEHPLSFVNRSNPMIVMSTPLSITSSADTPCRITWASWDQVPSSVTWISRTSFKGWVQRVYLLGFRNAWSLLTFLVLSVGGSGSVAGTLLWGQFQWPTCSQLWHFWSLVLVVLVFSLTSLAVLFPVIEWDGGVGTVSFFVTQLVFSPHS